MTKILTYARRALRVVGALARFSRKHTPRWLLPVAAILVFTPGPDELLLLAVVLVPVLRSADARRELAGAVTQAWKGQS